MFHRLHMDTILIRVHHSFWSGLPFVSVGFYTCIYCIFLEMGVEFTGRLHMSLFLYRLISYVNPRLWHNHIISVPLTISNENAGWSSAVQQTEAMLCTDSTDMLKIYQENKKCIHWQQCMCPKRVCRPKSIKSFYAVRHNWSVHFFPCADFKHGIYTKGASNFRFWKFLTGWIGLKVILLKYFL